MKCVVSAEVKLCMVTAEIYRHKTRQSMYCHWNVNNKVVYIRFKRKILLCHAPSVFNSLSDTLSELQPEEPKRKKNIDINTS